MIEDILQASKKETKLNKKENHHGPTHLLNTYLLRGYYMLSTVRVTEDRAVGKAGKNFFS